MKASLVVLAATAALALAPPASAQPPGNGAPEPPPAGPVVDPGWGVSVSGETGFGVLSGRSDWNRELEGAGHAPLEGGIGELGGRVSLHLSGWELSFLPTLVLGLPAGEGDLPPTYTAGSIMGELGYDFFPQQDFTFGPSVGAGLLHASVCSFGTPEAASAVDDGAPLLRQILANPGRESCLDSDSFVARVGGVIGFRIPEPMMERGSGTLYANLRPSFSWPLYSSDQSLNDADLPSFDGPSSPHPSFAVRLEVGLLFGAGRR